MGSLTPSACRRGTRSTAENMSMSIRGHACLGAVANMTPQIGFSQSVLMSPRAKTAPPMTISRNTSDLELENARVEYQATHDAYIHYDDFAWKVGTVLIAGVFVYWGFLLDKKPDLDKMCWANLFVSITLSIWALYAAHDRQIYRYKVHRLHELERLLGMQQHLRFSGPHPAYRITPPRGHWLNSATYALGALGGAVLGLFSAPASAWQTSHFVLYVANVGAVIATLFWVWHIGIETSVVLRSLNESKGSVSCSGKGNS